MRNIVLLILFVIPLVAISQKPFMQWDFENIKNRNSIEVLTGIADTIEGNL